MPGGIQQRQRLAGHHHQVSAARHPHLDPGIVQHRPGIVTEAPGSAIPDALEPGELRA